MKGKVNEGPREKWGSGVMREGKEGYELHHRLFFSQVF